MIRDNFQSLAKDKITLMNLFCSDYELAQCLLNNEPNFKDIDITAEQRENLAYNQVYPLPITIGTEQEKKSFITMRIAYNNNTRSNTIKVGKLTIYACCHKDLIRTDYGVLRFDYMVQRISKLLSEAKDTPWIGSLTFSSSDDIIYDSSGNFPGIELVFNNAEFI